VASASEDEVSLRLGADPPSRIVHWVGIPVSIAMAAILSIVLPYLSGVFALVCMVAVWYSWQLPSMSRLQIDSDRVKSTTPLRAYSATWDSIKTVKLQAHITIFHFDGTKFRLPQYTSTPFTRFLTSHSHYFGGRKKLEEALTESMGRLDPTKQSTTHHMVQWTYPPNLFVGIAVFVSCAVELIVLVWKL
jgi:hypothetical protein